MVGDELVAGGFEFRTYQSMVEDLAVVDNDDGSVFIEHWLSAGGDIDNGKAAMAQMGMFVVEESVGIGSTMGDRAGHTFQYAPGCGIRFHHYEPGNATHHFSVSNNVGGPLSLRSRFGIGYAAGFISREGGVRRIEDVD